ncbi:hypothetical protein PMIN06_012915 [Paraphaeosphaeria minitans]
MPMLDSSHGARCHCWQARGHICVSLGRLACRNEQWAGELDGGWREAAGRQAAGRRQAGESLKPEHVCVCVCVRRCEEGALDYSGRWRVAGASFRRKRAATSKRTRPALLSAITIMLSSLDGSTTRQKMTVQRPDPPTVGRHVPTVYLDTARYCAGPHVATPLRSEAGRELAARTHVVDHGQSTSALWEAARSQAVSNAHDGFAELAPGLIDPLHTFLPLRLLFYLCLHGLPTRYLRHAFPPLPSRLMLLPQSSHPTVSLQPLLPSSCPPSLTFF